jgi:SNF2 family DNA or RNA helicase
MGAYMELTALDSLDSEGLAKLVRRKDIQGQHMLDVIDDLLICSDSFQQNLVKLAVPNDELREKLTLAFDEQIRTPGHIRWNEYSTIGSVKKALDFLHKSVLSLDHTCPICLEELANGEESCITDCGHAFHRICLETSLKQRNHCPSCRSKNATMYSTKEVLAVVDPWLKYGTKMQTMVRKLKEIMIDYPGERLLLFVQFRNMRKKLEAAFQEFNVPFLNLSGTTQQQGATITRWQSGSCVSDFLMMLSCEEHNSGVTLTSARLRWHIGRLLGFTCLCRYG